MPALSSSAALAAVDVADEVVATAARHLGATAPDGADPVDAAQAVAYDLAHAAAGLAAARAALERAATADTAALAVAYAAEAVADLAGRAAGRGARWGGATEALAEPAVAALLDAGRDPDWLASLADADPVDPVADDALEALGDAFRRFAAERIAPVADEIHRRDADIPDAVVDGLAAMGAFGLSVPEAYGGSATGGPGDTAAMVVATEELSRVSLGAGGSLITRPEILARALLAGGTDEQKRRWLPRLADGSLMAAVAVTEPDHGSDVANLTVSATPDDGDWVVRGTKTWSTFAARAEALMVLARTDPDRAKAHRGLSLFVVDKPRTASEGFVLTQPGGGRLEGRPIATLGYRGMHSYELAFDGWRVPAANLVGGEAGLGRGFALQMAGFETGRLQTAARAVGVMRAALDAARTHSSGRRVFGRRLDEQQLTRVKLARMAATIAACRAATFATAERLAGGGAGVEAAMVKAASCRAAEWVTREAMQLHGGYGYAEEYPVSRLFVDARVLSIFEGADETLALKVVARRLVAAAAAPASAAR